MPCIHGLDDNNCPTCRIINHSVPNRLLKVRELYNNDLKPAIPDLNYNNSEKEDFINDLVSKNLKFNLNSINLTPKPHLINQIPNFENKMLSERLNEINLDKSDIFGISKKITLDSSELKVKKKRN